MTKPLPIRKAVLPVAGLGTRFLPITKAVPKELLPIVDRPLIQYAVDEARAAGIEQFIFVTGRGKGAIADYFDSAFELEAALTAKDKKEDLRGLRAILPEPGNVSFVRQQAPMGLGHAVWCARHLVGQEPFAVMLPDMLMAAKPSALAQAVATYDEVGGNVIVVEPVPEGQAHKYGIVAINNRRGRLARMTGMVEKPAPGTEPSNLFISGRYILQPEIFSILSMQTRGAGGEIQLTDAMVKLMERQPFYALEYDGVTYDCGDKLGFLEATIAMALERADLGPRFREILERILR